MKVCQSLRYLRQRVGEKANVQHKRNYRRRRHVIRNNQRSAHYTDHDVPEVADKTHGRLHQSAQKLTFPCRSVKFFVILLKFIYRFLRAVKNSDDIVSRVHFLDMPVKVSEIPLLLTEELLRTIQDDKHCHYAQQRASYHRKTEDIVGNEHHNKRTEKEYRLSDEQRKAVVQRLSDGVHVVGHTGQNVAESDFVKIRQRQSVDLFVDFTTHFLRYSLRNGDKDLFLKNMQYGAA